jgi:hypothetical protein
MKITNDMQDALRGIQRGLDSMKAGRGVPLDQAFAEMRARHKKARRQKRKLLN